LVKAIREFCRLMAIGIDGDFSPENLISMRAHQAIEVTESGLRDVSLVLGAAKSSTTIAGRIRAESGTLPPNTRPIVTLGRMNSKQDARTEDEEDIFVNNGGSGGFAQAKPDGTFEIKNVAPGTYEIEVGALTSKLEEWYTKSALVGGRDVLNSGLTVSGVPLSIDAVVSPGGAALEGVVKDHNQQLATNVLVLLVPDTARERRHSLYKTVTTDQNGHFILRGIDPGDYTAYSFDDIEDNAWFDADAMKRYSNDGVKVTLRVGEKTQTQLRLVLVQ